MKLFFAVQNLRSIKEMDYIELKPITVLVGANNSGKSSLLRLFPIFRQSIESNSSCIDWSGKSFTDGQYRNVVTDNEWKEDITFCFKIQDIDIDNNTIENGASEYDYLVQNRFEQIEYKLVVGYSEMGTIIKKLIFNINNYDINVEIEFTKNGQEVKSFKINNISINNNKIESLIDTITIIKNKNVIFPVFSTMYSKYTNTGWVRQSSFGNVIGENLIDLLKVSFKKFNIKNKRGVFLDLLDKILRNVRLDMGVVNELLLNVDEKTRNEFYANLKKDKKLIENIDLLCSMFWAFTAINTVSELLGGFFEQSLYLKRDRAIGLASYGIDDFKSAEIEADGRNMPNFVARLRKRDLTEFSDWLESKLGVKMLVQRKENRFRIMFDRKTSKVNFAYSGYGISQILPIFALIWKISKMDIEKEKKSNSFQYPNSKDLLKPIAIEQPESHLHPSLQSGIADAIENTLAKKSKNLKPFFIIETHSKSFVERLGKLVQNNKISRSKVNIVLFSENPGTFENNGEESSDNCYSHIKETYFNERGVLENWPFGFLG